MKVDAVIEHEDGSATVMLSDISKWEQEALIQAGFVALLEKYAKEEAEKKKVPAILKKENA